MSESEADTDGNRDEQYLAPNGIYLLGTEVAYLKRAAFHQYTVKARDESDGNYIVGTLEKINRILTLSKLDLTIQRDIEGMAMYLDEKYEKSDDGNIPNISEEDAKDLEESVNLWDRILSDEFGEVDRIPLNGASLLDIPGLLKSPEELFGDERVWEDLPERPKEDLVQSMLSLGVRAPTGSIFLSLRAVEDRLREWYESETGRDIESRTFGQVIGELDDHYDEQDRPKILSHLQYLKEQRNEVAHPDKSPELREAESTLVNVRETIMNIEQQLSDESSD